MTFIIILKHIVAKQAVETIEKSLLLQFFLSSPERVGVHWNMFRVHFLEKKKIMKYIVMSNKVFEVVFNFGNQKQILILPDVNGICE